MREKPSYVLAGQRHQHREKFYPLSQREAKSGIPVVVRLEAHGTFLLLIALIAPLHRLQRRRGGG